MSFVIVSYCPHCGAPIWIDSLPLCLGAIPKTHFSCGCNPQKNVKNCEASRAGGVEVEITHTGSPNTKTVLCD